MKKIISVLMAIFICAFSVPAFAAEETEMVNI